jgi:hypothetical protein
VLEAAARAGFEPVLAASINFKATEALPWKVMPVYRYGFWPRMATTALSRGSQALASKLIVNLRRLKTRLFFSRIGFLWVIRNEPFEYLRWHPFDSAIPPWMMFSLAALAFPLRALFGLVRLLIPFRVYFAGLSGHLKTVCASAFQAALTLFTSQGPLEEWRFNRRKGVAFGQDTGRAVRELKLGPDDVVFVPTLAEPELIGLLKEFRRDFSVSIPGYHLLFRRNIYQGREPDYAAQDSNLLPLRNAFLQARELAEKGVRFYTDTAELCEQYNRLRVFDFIQCPIPHTYPPPVARSEGPLNLTYLGDARKEKGYPYLAGLVGDLHRDYVMSGKVRFVVQSNYNIRGGEPDAIVARSLLQSYPSSEVEVLPAPLPSEEYRRRLLDADVLLLPYSRDEYYARSSGVVIEALAAGIPVVVSAGSWLARQIAQPVCQYRIKAGTALDRVAPARIGEIWTGEGSAASRGRRSPDTLTFGSESAKVYSWLTVPPGADFLVLRFRFGAQAGQGVLCYADQVGDSRRSMGLTAEILVPDYGNREAAFLVRVFPGARRMWVALRNAFSDELMTVSLVSLEFRSSGSAEIPLAAVGCTFSFPGQFREAVAEIVRHYSHYRETAMANASNVNDFHNAARVVELTTSGARRELREMKAIA